MLPTSDPDRIDIAFDDDRLVADAGLLLPATLAQHLGLQELADSYLDLGDAAGRANAGDKLLTLVASALAGGDCIDDAAALRAGGTASVLGCTVKAPSTLGTFLRSFSQRFSGRLVLDPASRVSSHAAGRPAGFWTVTGSTERRRISARPTAWPRRAPASHGYTGVRGYHPICSRLQPGRVTC